MEELNKLDNLILDGGIEIVGLDDDGKFVYRFTDKLKDLDPDFYEHVSEQFYKQLMDLWQLGLISVSLDEKMPTVSVSERAFDEVAREMLTDSQRRILDVVIKALTPES